MPRIPVGLAAALATVANMFGVRVRPQNEPTPITTPAAGGGEPPKQRRPVGSPSEASEEETAGSGHSALFNPRRRGMGLTMEPDEDGRLRPVLEAPGRPVASEPREGGVPSETNS